MWLSPVKGMTIKLVGLSLLSVHILSTFIVTQRWVIPSSNHNDLNRVLSSTFQTLGYSRNILNSSNNNDHPLHHSRVLGRGKSKRESVRPIMSHVSTLNISQLAEDLVELEESTNVNYLRRLLNHSEVYRSGSWDGAGIVIEEYKLVFFTQGKVGTLMSGWLPGKLFFVSQ
jgi:hypothetical protein